MRLIYFILIFIFFISTSCNKFIEVPNPTTQIDRSTVFSSDATATSAVLGIYSSMMQQYTMASVNSSLFPGLSADEFTAYSGDQDLEQFYSNTINASNDYLNGYWGNAYQYIYGANSILEGLNDNEGVSITVKQQLTGEAKFIRAFCYFYLTNLFGDVPLILSTDYSQTAVAARTSRQLVYDQIIADLTDAQNDLSDQYLEGDNTSGMDRGRPNKWAATALLARVNLFLGNWNGATALSTSVINQSGEYNLVYDLDSVFLANSSEAIWQLVPVPTGINATWEGYVYILFAAPYNSYGVSLNSNLVNAFESGDQRKVHWVDSIQISGFTYYYAYKYKVSSGNTLTEYYMVLRLSEQYLIRAEARAMSGDLTGAMSDLNVIRNKAGLSNSNASDLPSLLAAIQNERRFELFSEWGHRWLDLKRTGTANTILSPVKSPSWQPYDTLYPIPKTEIQNDPNLTQNPNY